MMKQSQRKKQTQTDRHGSYNVLWENELCVPRWKKEKILFAFIIGMIVNFYATAAAVAVAVAAVGAAAAGVDDSGLSGLIKTSSSSFVLFKLSICRSVIAVLWVWEKDSCHICIDHVDWLGKCDRIGSNKLFIHWIRFSALIPLMKITLLGGKSQMQQNAVNPHSVCKDLENGAFLFHFIFYMDLLRKKAHTCKQAH